MSLLYLQRKQVLFDRFCHERTNVNGQRKSTAAVFAVLSTVSPMFLKAIYEIRFTHKVGT